MDVVLTEPGSATATLRNGFRYTLRVRGNDIRRQPGIVIREALDRLPYTCSFTIDGESHSPIAGDELLITDEMDGDRIVPAPLVINPPIWTEPGRIPEDMQSGPDGTLRPAPAEGEEPLAAPQDPDPAPAPVAEPPEPELTMFTVHATIAETPPLVPLVPLESHASLPKKRPLTDADKILIWALHGEDRAQSDIARHLNREYQQVYNFVYSVIKGYGRVPVVGEAELEPEPVAPEPTPEPVSEPPSQMSADMPDEQGWTLREDYDLMFHRVCGKRFKIKCQRGGHRG